MSDAPKKSLWVLNPNAPYFRFAMWVRHIWGCRDEYSYRPKACPMFWQTVLLTIATVVFSPAFVLGWLIVKFNRKIYAYCEKSDTFIDKLVTAFFDKSGASACLDKAPKEIKENAAMYLLFNFFTWVFGGFLSLCFIGTILYVLFMLIIHIPDIVIGICKALWWLISELPFYIWEGIMHVGYFIFFLFACIGWGMDIVFHYVGVAATWVFGVLTSMGFWSGVLWYFLVPVAVLLVAGVLLYAIFTSPWAKKLSAFIVMKANGYAAAREERAKRKEDEKQALREQSQETGEWDEYEIKYGDRKRPPPKFIIVTAEFLCKNVDRIGVGVAKGWHFVVGEKVETEERTYIEFSFVKSGWAALVATITKACPIVEIVSMEALEEAKKFIDGREEYTKENMDREMSFELRRFWRDEEKIPAKEWLYRHMLLATHEDFSCEKDQQGNLVKSVVAAFMLDEIGFGTFREWIDGIKGYSPKYVNPFLVIAQEKDDAAAEAEKEAEAADAPPDENGAEPEEKATEDPEKDPKP